MKKYLFLFLLSVFLFPQCNSAQTIGAEIFYLKREPKIKIENPPILILLHGLGSNENDLFGLVQHLPDSLLILALRAPRTIKEGSYRWYDLQWIDGIPKGNVAELEESRDMLIRFIEDLHKKHKFDKQKVFLGGFSQGAVMSLSVALKKPELLNGILFLSGKMPDGAEATADKKENYKKLKIFMVHGTEDKVLSIEDARSVKSFLENHNFPLEYNEFSMPHTINRETLASLVYWLKKSMR
jgi:phospholipase/carboxylesterase